MTVPSPTVQALHRIEDITTEMAEVIRRAGMPIASSAYATALATQLHAAQLADNEVRADLRRERT